MFEVGKHIGVEFDAMERLVLNRLEYLEFDVRHRNQSLQSWILPLWSRLCSVQVRSVQRSEVSLWIAPKERFVKFNVDATVKGGVGPTTIGGVLRDHTGVILHRFSKYIGFSDPASVELQACTCYASSPWANSKPLVIESDSELAVNWIKQPLLVPVSFHELRFCMEKKDELLMHFLILGCCGRLLTAGSLLMAGHGALVTTGIEP
ncbi:hypothetical protein V6N11_018477 [Hibiscus sabdariffa]|uniref:RNase H type-1 domain-containing protein n=1 Tax=Hibiscus sabdariffa TaxID=183260 RepID=A0ABR2T8B9_9ROSI